MPIMVGLGADELSIAAARVGEVRERIRSITFVDWDDVYRFYFDATDDGHRHIGIRLSLAEKTVKNYVSSILSKLNLNNRVQIALLVHDAGLIDDQGGQLR